MQENVTIATFLFCVLVPVTLIANGVGSHDENKLAEQGGCYIGLNHWYICLTGLCLVKLVIEIIRLISVKYRGKDHMECAIIGNYVTMPFLFFAFFIYTHKLEKNLSAIDEA